MTLYLIAGALSLLAYAACTLAYKNSAGKDWDGLNWLVVFGYAWITISSCYEHALLWTRICFWALTGLMALVSCLDYACYRRSRCRVQTNS